MTTSDLFFRLRAAIDPEDIEDLVFQALTEHRTPMTPDDLAQILRAADKLLEGAWQSNADQVARALYKAAREDKYYTPDGAAACLPKGSYALLGADGRSVQSAAVALCSVFGEWIGYVQLFFDLLESLEPEDARTPERLAHSLSEAARDRDPAGRSGWLEIPRERVAMLCHGLSPLLTGMRDD